MVFIFIVGKLKALVNICNMKGNCWIVTGPEVKVDSTNTYDPERLKFVFNLLHKTC